MYFVYGAAGCGRVNTEHCCHSWSGLIFCTERDTRDSTFRAVSFTCGRLAKFSFWNGGVGADILYSRQIRTNFSLLKSIENWLATLPASQAQDNDYGHIFGRLAQTMF